MINLIFGMFTLLLSTVTFTGEDEGEMLYSIEIESIRHDYVTEQELQNYLYTGKIREDVISFNKLTKLNYEKSDTIMFTNVQYEHSSTRK